MSSYNIFFKSRLKWRGIQQRAKITTKQKTVFATSRRWKMKAEVKICKFAKVGQARYTTIGNPIETVQMQEKQPLSAQLLAI